MFGRKKKRRAYFGANVEPNCEYCANGVMLGERCRCLLNLSPDDGGAAGDGSGTVRPGATDEVKFVNDKPAPQPEEHYGDLNVTKTVSGSGGDPEREWHFRVELSESTIVTAEVRDGSVNTMGSNKMGALGTDVNFGTDIATDTMAPAGFKGKAIGVYTFGSNTVVIDENNSLWIAGSSRSGQKTGSGTEMIVKAGWEDITPPDCKVIKAAGFDSTIFALTSDGKLWVTGQNCGFVNGDVWLDGWECITGYNTILDLQCSRYNVTFLNSDGTVYRASFGSVATNAGYVSASWYSAAKNVAAYSIGTNSGMVWCDSDGRFGNDNWSVYYPDSWNIVNAYGSTEGWGPQYSVDSIANVENGFYVLASDGVLHYVANGTDTEIQTPKAVEEIYVTGSSCVAELQGGGFVLFDNAGNQK